MRTISEVLEFDTSPPRRDSGSGGELGDGPLERDRIAGVLQLVGGNVARAARRLGMPRSTLRYRLGKYGLDARSFEAIAPVHEESGDDQDRFG